MNDPWFDTWLECRRIAARTAHRVQARFAARRLRHAERELGELGWQQAYFDDNDQAVHELHVAEREQARLVFDIAENKEQFAELKAASQEKNLALHRQIQAAEIATAQLEAHAIELLETFTLKKTNGSPLLVLETLEKAIASAETQLRQSRSHLQTLHETLTETETQFRRDTERLQITLRNLDTDLRSLQEKKAIHFTKIGHDLADVGIAPMNQPDILPRVLALREKSASLQNTIATSLSTSRTLGRSIRCSAYLTFGLLVLSASALISLLGLIFFRLFRLH